MARRQPTHLVSGATGHRGKQTLRTLTGLQSYGDKFVCGSSSIQTNRPEAVSLHRSSKQEKKKKKKKRDQMERGWRRYKMEHLQSEEWTWTICKTVGSNSLQERTTRNRENKHKEEHFISCLPVSSQRSQHIKQMFSVNKSLRWHTASSRSLFPSLWFNRSLLIKRRKNWRQSARGANSDPLKGYSIWTITPRNNSQPTLRSRQIPY